MRNDHVFAYIRTLKRRQRTAARSERGGHSRCDCWRWRTSPSESSRLMRTNFALYGLGYRLHDLIGEQSAGLGRIEAVVLEPYQVMWLVGQRTDIAYGRYCRHPPAITQSSS